MRHQNRMTDDERLAQIEALYRERFRHFKRVASRSREIRSAPSRRCTTASPTRSAAAAGFAVRVPLRHGSGEPVNAARRASREPSGLELRSEVESRRNGSADLEPHVLYGVIRELPERQRLVLFLRYYGDLDYRGIARAPDVRVGTVSATLHQRTPRCGVSSSNGRFCMPDADPRVRDELERLLPLPDESGADWRSFLARVDQPPRSRRRAKLALAGAGVVTMAAVVALAWPFGADRGGVLERALAAADDGPILHMVFRYDRPSYTTIDLESGRRLDNVYGVSEVWYGRNRGFRHVGRIGDIVVYEGVGAAAADPYLDTYVLLARSYVEALKSGRARLVGEGEVDGRAVYWISVWEGTSRSRSDGEVKLHRFAQEVAVSEESYEPVARRSRLDGKPDSRALERIVEFETLSAEEVRFERLTPPRRRDEPHAFLCCGTEAIPLGQARSVIRRVPLWLGGEFRNLELRRVSRVEGQTRKEGEREWTGTITALELFYGALTEDGQPDRTRPYLRILEAENLHMSLARMAVAPEGNAIVQGNTATATIDGLSVQIEAGGQSEPQAGLLDAVEALEPMGSP
jgi:Sigma-70, region 4